MSKKDVVFLTAVFIVAIAAMVMIPIMTIDADSGISEEHTVPVGDNQDYEFDKDLPDSPYNVGTTYNYQYKVDNDISFGTAYLYDDWVVLLASGCSGVRVEIYNAIDGENADHFLKLTFTPEVDSFDWFEFEVRGHTAYNDILGTHLVDLLTYNFRGEKTSSGAFNLTVSCDDPRVKFTHGGSSVQYDTITIPVDAGWTWESGVSSNPALYIYNASHTYVDAIHTSKPGYLVVDRWSPSSGTVSGDVSIKLYVKNDTYTITLNPGSGGTVTPTTINYDRDTASIYIPTATKTGYTNVSWHTVDGTNVPLGTLSNPFVFFQYIGDLTLYADWDANDYTVTFDANGGTVSPPSITADYGSAIELPTPTRTGFQFIAWYDSRTGGEQLPLNPDGKYVVLNNITVYAHWRGGVYWSNGYNNSVVETLFHYENVSGNYTHYIYTALQDSMVIDDGKTTKTVFFDSGYYLVISVKGEQVQITATLYDADDHVIKTKTSNFGVHSSFTIKIDALHGKLEFGLVNDFQTFEAYSVSYYQTVLDYSNIDAALNKSMGEIERRDLDSGTTHVGIQVVHTEVFLETYGVVMNNPSINIQVLFPQYDNVRLNFFSFAVRGDSFTVNNHTMNIKGGIIDIGYIKVKDTYRWAEIGTAGVSVKSIDFRNVYVTWLDGKIYLGFANDSFVVDMTDYIETVQTGGAVEETPVTPSRVVSFGGVWYFTTGLFEPYQTTEKTWHIDWYGGAFDLNALLLVFSGLCVFGGLICIRRYGFEWYDLVILGGAVATALFCLAV